MANLSFIMQVCSMPFEMPLGDFVSQALETNEDAFGALLKKRTKDDILTYLKSPSVTLSDLKELLEDILESLNKPHGFIKDIQLKGSIIFLIENGINLIPPQVKITKEEGQETEEAQGDEQFEIDDNRSLDKMYQDISDEGLQPVLNDYLYV